MNNTNSTGSSGLPNLTESCGCWVSDGARWAELDAGAIVAVAGVEADLGHPFMANFSADGVRWTTHIVCEGSPCLLSRPIDARYARLIPIWFDGYLDTPLRFSGGLLSCRYRLEAQGLTGGTVGDTAALLWIREAQGASRPASPPNLTAADIISPTPGAAAVMVYARPFGPNSNQTPVVTQTNPPQLANVSVAALWAGAALDLYGVGAYLEDGLSARQRAAFNLSSSPVAVPTAPLVQSQTNVYDLLWLAVVVVHTRRSDAFRFRLSLGNGTNSSSTPSFFVGA